MASLRAEHDQHVETLVTVARAKLFLGREFLLWLWFRSETDKEPAEITVKSLSLKLAVVPFIDDRIVLESASAKCQEQMLKGGEPSRSEEAAYGLLGGKSIKEVRLGFHVDGFGDFSALLQFHELIPRSLKLPKIEETSWAQSDESPVVLRLRLVEIYFCILDQLFAEFLTGRLAKTWEASHWPKIRKWTADRSSSLTVRALH